MFLKIVIQREGTLKAERISEYWYGKNLTQKGLDKLTTELNTVHKPKGEVEEHTPEFINNEWRRLAAFFGGAHG